jgi:hypothetical protein
VFVQSLVDSHPSLEILESSIGAICNQVGRADAVAKSAGGEETDNPVSLGTLRRDHQRRAQWFPHGDASVAAGLEVDDALSFRVLNVALAVGAVVLVRSRIL